MLKGHPLSQISKWWRWTSWYVWKRWITMTKHGSPLKNHDGLRMLEGYWHSLHIIRYKHWRYQRVLLMVNYIGMYTRSKKWMKTRMETTIGLYGKGNEINLFYIGLCLVLISTIVPCTIVVEACCTKSI
jgi:hypothetical protein